MKKKSLSLLILLCLICIFLCACGEEPVEEAVEVSASPAPSQTVKPTPAAKPTPSVSPSPVPTEPVKEEPKNVNPLTGLPMDEEKLDDRPVAIMLNNLKAALPQQGNSQADIIYETVTEGGITRMLGVYQSVEGVPTIGSVRSSRTCYVEMALGHDAVYVHAGGSDEAYARMDEWKVDHMDGVRGQYSYAGAGLFWRERDRVEGKWFDTEHSLVTSGEAVAKVLEGSGLRLEHGEDYAYEMSFAKDAAPEAGEPAHKITIPFSQYKTGVFTFEEASGAYLAEEYGQPYVDGNTGEQVAVTNVLILLTEVRYTGDRYGHTDVELKGGEGWFACGGKICPITWEKGERTEQFRYFTEDGEPLTLGQGRSYVNIIPNTGEITVE